MNLKHKYQFTIFEYSDKINNSAATKAVADCNKIFEACGYKDFTLTVDRDKGRNVKFYWKAFIAISRFLLKIERNALVAVQYPMLNNVFKFFIKAAKFKGIKFFCVIHDVESLRSGGADINSVKREITNLNYYDGIIAHNNKMQAWLQDNGLKVPVVQLELFDYLIYNNITKPMTSRANTVAFAGNLEKSSFVYSLNKINTWNFNLYGPNYNPQLQINGYENTVWRGVYSPEQIVNEIKGDFGLIWDGTKLEMGNENWSNYLRYNNPHKFSLYLAAGLPVVAPKNSAISEFIVRENVGVLIQSLDDLDQITVTNEQYEVMRNNCFKIMQRVKSGHYLKTAIRKIEEQLFRPV